MTQEEFEKYQELNDKFVKRCEYIADILKECNERYKFIDTWYIFDGEVTGEGDEIWSYGGHEHHYVHFPFEYIYSDDSILYDYIKTVNEEKRRREEEKEKNLRKNKEELFEQLKKELNK